MVLKINLSQKKKKQLAASLIFLSDIDVILHMTRRTIHNPY